MDVLLNVNAITWDQNLKVLCHLYDHVESHVHSLKSVGVTFDYCDCLSKNRPSSHFHKCGEHKTSIFIKIQTTSEMEKAIHVLSSMQVLALLYIYIIQRNQKQ